MHLVIFEGVHWRSFAPLSLGRPVFMLATGMATLLEKQIRHCMPTRLTLWVRPELEEFVRRRIIPHLQLPAEVNVPLDAEPALLMSGRTLHINRFRIPDEPCAVVDEGEILRNALVHMPGLAPTDALGRSERWLRVLQLPREAPQTRLVERLWDLIKWNEESLIEDYAQNKRKGHSKPAGAYHLVDEEQVFLGAEVRPQPGAVLDGSTGPVFIDDHATIGANAVLQGPCYIGPYAEVRALAVVRPGTSIGGRCKVGGEIANSIMFGLSNKSHEGFVGDSYVGKWVNLGAGTTTSNLKNTYGEITMQTPAGVVRTGRRFLGALIGDHVKTGIGTRLMAGSYVGFSSMLAASGIAPKFIPSYSFLTDKGSEPYRVDKAIEVMKAVFGRRNRTWDEVDQTVVEYAARVAPEVEMLPAGATA